MNTDLVNLALSRTRLTAKRSDKYYLSDGDLFVLVRALALIVGAMFDIMVQVGSTLYRIPHSILAHASPIWGGLMNGQTKIGGDGSEDTNPIVLHANINDFEALMDSAYGSLTNSRCVQYLDA
jgi:hypothetical protein